MSFFLSFFLGLFFTCGFLIFSVLCVLGVKYFLSTSEESAPTIAKEPTPPPKKPSAPRKKRAKQPSVIRSVEIDPNSIDRIYVKKMN